MVKASSVTADAVGLARKVFFDDIRPMWAAVDREGGSNAGSGVFFVPMPATEGFGLESWYLDKSCRSH